MATKGKAKPARAAKATAKPAAKGSAAKPAKAAPQKVVARRDDISSDLRKVALAHALRRLQ